MAAMEDVLDWYAEPYDPDRPVVCAARATINWRFNTQDARTKSHRLYPFNSKID